jgi:hypothetical protein
MISLLLFCVLFAVWVYLILEPLTRAWNTFCLWFGNHVVSKRDHKDHVHAWVEYPMPHKVVCTICGKIEDDYV